MRVLTADWFRRQSYTIPACFCVWQRLPQTWWLALIHPRCPQHGQPPHWKATA